jgi:hypothetical protein
VRFSSRSIIAVKAESDGAEQLAQMTLEGKAMKYMSQI